MSRQRPADPSAVAAEVESLYARHGTTVLALCRSLLRDRAEAEDAAQQTFLSAQRALVNGSQPRDPAPWLATIARNECYARVRARATRPVPTAHESEDVSPDAHATAVRRAQVAELRDALAGLPAQQREAILLREVRGLSYDEVAASLAVTTSAVESLLFRARRRLQLSLREAAAAVAPEGLLAPLRELAARLAGGGVAIPGVAKVVAVGVGAVAVAGGADVTPQLVRHARTPAAAASTRTAPAAPRHELSAATPTPVAPPARVAPAVFHPRPAANGEHEAATSERGGAAEHEHSQPESSGSEADGGARGESDGQEQSADGAPVVFRPVPPPDTTSAAGDAERQDGGQEPQQETQDAADGHDSGGD